MVDQSDLSSISIFGVRTPLIDDYLETCSRLKIPTVAAIQVDAQKPRLQNSELLIKLESLTVEQLRHPFIAAAFSSLRRQELVELAVSSGFQPSAALIDPTSVIASSSFVGVGTYINALSVIGSVSRLGKHVFINRACNLGHHVLVGDYVSFGPGVTVTSNVRIGFGAAIGAGAVLLPGIVIGDHAVISAGTRVAVDVPDNHLAIGHEPELKPISSEKKLLYYSGQE